MTRKKTAGLQKVVRYLGRLEVEDCEYGDFLPFEFEGEPLILLSSYDHSFFVFDILEGRKEQ